MYWDYKQPVRVKFGKGMIGCLCEEIEALGLKCGLLVTSPSFVKRGKADEVCQMSGGAIKHVFSGVSANPDVSECDACANLLREKKCDFVVALGGGSVMDCAKAAATFCLSDKPSTAYLGTGEPIPQAHLPIIAMPTTAGTGSEITSVSVLSDHARGVKAPMSSDGFFPTLAIVDPELTYSVPPHLTACTGMDVLCHAIESYWSVNHQPVCSALSVHAARLVFDNLRAAVNESDAKARCAMAEASVTAGLAFALPKTTSAHACSYPLTNRLGIAHGEACGLTIAHFTRFNASHGCERVQTLAHELGFADANALADAIDALKADTGLRTDLKDFALTDELFNQLATESMHPNMKNNPVAVSLADVKAMYRSMM